MIIQSVAETVGVWSLVFGVIRAVLAFAALEPIRKSHNVIMKKFGDIGKKLNYVPDEPTSDPDVLFDNSFFVSVDPTMPYLKTGLENYCREWLTQMA